MIGQPLRRTEDPTLLRGEGRYTDDLNEPGQAYAYIVRSPHAHGLLNRVSVESAKGMPGVFAVYTAADLTAYGPHKSPLYLKQRDGSGMKKPIRKSLASDRVRFVGDPVACVVAETYLQAKDAAEAVELDIEPLPAVAVASEGAKPGAPQIYDDVPGNVSCDFLWGEPGKVAEAFGKAAHVTKLTLRNTRVVVAAMEPRAGLCSYDAASGRWTLSVPGQGVWGQKGQLVDMLGVTPDKVRIRTGHVGGSFGMKGSIYPEYLCLAHAARALGVVPLRPARPRPRDDRRARARQGRQVPRAARHGLRKHGRVPRDHGAAAADDERGEELLQRLRDPAPRGVDEDRVHQHQSRGALPRRGPPSLTPARVSAMSVHAASVKFGVRALNLLSQA